MADTAATIPTSMTDHAKLTVAQLKALCKDRKISGYSKLGKAALLERLSKHASLMTGSSGQISSHQLIIEGPSSTQPCTLSKQSSLSSPSIFLVPSPLSNTGWSASAHVSNPHSPVQPTPSVYHVPSTSKISELSSLNHAWNSSLPIVSSASNTTQLTESSSGKNTGVKRPAVDSSSESRKMSRLTGEAIKDSRRVNFASVEYSVQAQSNLVSKPLAPPSSVSFTTSTISPSITKEKRPVAPVVHARKILDSTFSSKSSPSAKNAPSIGRFRSLMPARHKDRHKVRPMLSKNDHASCDNSAIAQLAYLDFQSSSPVSFQSITLPPSLSQRKRVQAWSVILSGLSDTERRQCALVSRAFRYAVYLSAVCITRKEFGGRRFAQLSQQHNMAMTNFWPYLKYLRLERGNRMQIYRTSFLSRFFGSWNPISERIWGSPDHEKQLVVALRFIMTRVWFTILVDGRDHETMKSSVVTEAREVVKDEIWSITVDTISSPTSQATSMIYYVLEPTCEVIGLPPTLKDPLTHSKSSSAIKTFTTLPVRVDWSEYVEYRLMPTGFHAAHPPSLLSHLKWTNMEEYNRAISKLWLARIAKEGELGLYKKKVAERYVLACVVGNSVSGQWMSSNHMAQVFAGTASSDLLPARKKETPRVNLFLPEHHLVESVHFTTSKGQALHPALAVVQTPGREYFILRDNGMEVGCEEDGIWPAWTELLVCDGRGVLI